MSGFLNPTIPQFKSYFFRDFPYGEDINTSVTDADLEKAFLQAAVNINRTMFPNQEMYQMAYMYLWAHYLVIDMRAASQGINGQFNFVEQSKSVGSVSQSFAIPQQILDHPSYSMLTQTNYGAKYLQMLLPQLAGNAFIAYGRTLP